MYFFPTTFFSESSPHFFTLKTPSSLIPIPQTIKQTKPNFCFNFQGYENHKPQFSMAAYGNRVAAEEHNGQFIVRGRDEFRRAHGGHSSRVIMCINRSSWSELYGRCIFTCGDRFRLESAVTTGLKKQELRQIPVGVYGSDIGAKIKVSDCAICLEEFENGDMVRVLPICSHGFHLRCIDEWLLSHSSCPNCRHSLLQPLPRKGKQDAAGVLLPLSQPDSVSSPVVVVVESSH